MYIYLLLIIFLTILDQATKQYMLFLSNGNIGYSIPIIDNALRFTYVENHGGIFGVFQGHIKIFTIISILLIIFVIFTEFKNFKKYNRFIKIGICFVSAGALGNMIDRLFRGYVIDMLDFYKIWKFIFNIADVYIHIGLYIIIIGYFITNKNKNK